MQFCNPTRGGISTSKAVCHRKDNKRTFALIFQHHVLMTTVLASLSKAFHALLPMDFMPIALFITSDINAVPKYITRINGILAMSSEENSL